MSPDVDFIWAPIAVTYKGKSVKMPPTLLRIFEALYSNQDTGVHWTTVAKRRNSASVYITKLREILTNTNLVIEYGRRGRYVMRTLSQHRVNEIMRDEELHP